MININKINSHHIFGPTYSYCRSKECCSRHWQVDGFLHQVLVVSKYETIGDSPCKVLQSPVDHRALNSSVWPVQSVTMETINIFWKNVDNMFHFQCLNSNSFFFDFLWTMFLCLNSWISIKSKSKFLDIIVIHVFKDSVESDLGIVRLTRSLLDIWQSMCKNNYAFEMDRSISFA